MTKYDPLEMHLLCLPASQNEITLTFDQVEKIIDGKLPRSAYDHRAWWSNYSGGTHSHAHAWMDVGWEVESVDQSKKWVRFVRR